MRQNPVFTNPLSDSFYLQIRPNGESCNISYGGSRLEATDTGLEERSLMPKVLLEKIVREQVNAQPSKSVVFSWEGGEPMLSGIDFYRDAVRMQKKVSRDRIVFNILETSGLLIDVAWCQFFKENNFFVYVYLGGPEHCHNHYYIDKNNKKTFSKVVDGINLLKKHRVNYVVQVAVTQYSVNYPKEIYRFLKELDVAFINFIPLADQVTKKNNDPQSTLQKEEDNEKLADWSVSPPAFSNFLCEIFDEWVKNDVGERFIKTFDATLTAYAGGKSLEACEFGKSCRCRLLVNYDGSVYPCNQYVFPEYKLGNLYKEPLLAVAHGARRAEIADAKLNQASRECKECGYINICNGHCKKPRFTYSSNGEYGHSYHCHGIKQYLDHTKPYMEFMANELKEERPPANVMEFAMGLDGM